MAVSFSASIPRTLKVGDQIEIEFTILKDSTEFKFSLVGENDHKPDQNNVIYHHKIMYAIGQTALNSRRNGNWGTEAIYDVVHANPGDAAKMLILIKEVNVLTVHFNNKPHTYIDYRHDFNLEEIKYMQFWAGLDKIKSVKTTFID